MAKQGAPSASRWRPSASAQSVGGKLSRHDSPGKDKESNWLPPDTGDFNVIMRIYWPKENALNGTRTPPPIKKVS